MTATVNHEQGVSNPAEPGTKQTRLVICITGMPGAGKSTAAEVSTMMGFEVYRMGDDVRMEAERRKLAPTDENLGAVMLQLRQSGGPVAIAHLSKQRIERESKSNFVLIDGIRNVNEYLEFKKLGKAVLVRSTPRRSGGSNFCRREPALILLQASNRLKQGTGGSSPWVSGNRSP